jgi:hypothetical protein
MPGCLAYSDYCLQRGRDHRLHGREDPRGLRGHRQGQGLERRRHGAAFVVYLMSYDADSAQVWQYPNAKGDWAQTVRGSAFPGGK